MRNPYIRNILFDTIAEHKRTLKELSSACGSIDGISNFSMIATAKLPAAVSDLYEKLENLRLDIKNERFILGVVGEFSTGKSAFLNSLLLRSDGEDRLLLETAPEQTWYKFYISHDDKKKCEIIFSDSMNNHVVKSDIPAFLKDSLSRENAMDNVKEIRITWPFIHKELREMVLVDTPGLCGGEGCERSKAIARAFLKHECDAIILTATMERPDKTAAMEEHASDLLLDWLSSKERFSKKQHGTLFLVATCLDRALKEWFQSIIKSPGDITIEEIFHEKKKLLVDSISDRLLKGKQHNIQHFSLYNSSSKGFLHELVNVEEDHGKDGKERFLKLLDSVDERNEFLKSVAVLDRSLTVLKPSAWVQRAKSIHDEYKIIRGRLITCLDTISKSCGAEINKLRKSISACNTIINDEEGFINTIESGLKTKLSAFVNGEIKRVRNFTSLSDFDTDACSGDTIGYTGHHNRIISSDFSDLGQLEINIAKYESQNKIYIESMALHFKSNAKSDNETFSPRWRKGKFIRLKPDDKHQIADYVNHTFEFRANFPAARMVLENFWMRFKLNAEEKIRNNAIDMKSEWKDNNKKPLGKKIKSLEAKSKQLENNKKLAEDLMENLKGQTVNITAIDSRCKDIEKKLVDGIRRKGISPVGLLTGFAMIRKIEDTYEIISDALS